MHGIEALANICLPGGLVMTAGQELEVEEITSSMEKAERLGLLRITRPPVAPEPAVAPGPARKRRRGG